MDKKVKSIIKCHYEFHPLSMAGSVLYCFLATFVLCLSYASDFMEKTIDFNIIILSVIMILNTVFGSEEKKFYLSNTSTRNDIVRAKNVLGIIFTIISSVLFIINFFIIFLISPAGSKFKVLAGKLGLFKFITMPLGKILLSMTISLLFFTVISECLPVIFGKNEKKKGKKNTDDKKLYKIFWIIIIFFPGLITIPLYYVTELFGIFSKYFVLNLIIFALGFVLNSYISMISTKKQDLV